MTARLHTGDALAVLAEMPAASIDACVTDPPAGISFMGKTWDKPGVMGFSGARAMPAMTSSRNPSCRSCGGRKRAGAATKSCICAAPDWNDQEYRQQDRQAFIVFMTDVFTEVYRVLKPGAYGLVWGLPRTSHWTAIALEDAGFEVRDKVLHLFGSGFPKSLDVSKAIDKAAGADRTVIETGKPLKRMIPGADQHRTGSWIKDNGREFIPTVTAPATDAAREWEGWGTALKPAYEDWWLIRKPLNGTVAQNVLTHGTGALNVDGCRIDGVPEQPGSTPPSSVDGRRGSMAGAMDRVEYDGSRGRWPANVVLDEEAAAELDLQAGIRTSGSYSGHRRASKFQNTFGEFNGTTTENGHEGSSGGASRFFYCAKASPSERGAFNDHPTVKPLALMRWLVRLVTPKGGTVLDPFCGSGSTLIAADREGFDAVGIDADPHAIEIATRRLREEVGPLFSEIVS